MTSDKLVELQIAEDSLHILHREISRMKNGSFELDTGEVMKLEKLTKIYAVVLAARKNTSALGGLNDDELKALVGDE